MKAWITKYALSAGILERDVQARGDGMATHRQPNGVTEFFHGEGKDWHRTRESAVARAEEMRLAKIASLEKQLAKLRALRFEP